MGLAETIRRRMEEQEGVRLPADPAGSMMGQDLAGQVRLLTATVVSLLATLKRRDRVPAPWPAEEEEGEGGAAVTVEAGEGLRAEQSGDGRAVRIDAVAVLEEGGPAVTVDMETGAAEEDCQGVTEDTTIDVTFNEETVEVVIPGGTATDRPYITDGDAIAWMWDDTGVRRAVVYPKAGYFAD